MRGTWQGSGTWQSSGPDLGGLLVPVVLVAVVVAVVEFILSIIVWLAIAAGIVLVLVAAGVVWWLRGAPKRKAEYAALYAAAFEARRPAQTVSATVAPQVRWPEQPAVTNNYGPQFHFSGPDAEAQMARVIRSAIRAGEAITREDEH
jgi:hypothetical protein